MRLKDNVTMFCVHKLRGSGYMFLICHVTLQNDVIQEPSDIMARSYLRCITILAIGNVVIEI